MHAVASPVARPLIGATARVAAVAAVAHAVLAVVLLQARRCMARAVLALVPADFFMATIGSVMTG